MQHEGPFFLERRDILVINLLKIEIFLARYSTWVRGHKNCEQGLNMYATKQPVGIFPRDSARASATTPLGMELVWRRTESVMSCHLNPSNPFRPRFFGGTKCGQKPSKTSWLIIKIPFKPEGNFINIPFKSINRPFGPRRPSFFRLRSLRKGDSSPMAPASSHPVPGNWALWGARTSSGRVGMGTGRRLRTTALWETQCHKRQNHQNWVL